MENHVQLIGNLGMAPESKQVNNTLRTSFSLATNTVYKDAEGSKKTMTDWHNVVAWGKLAQTMNEYLKKGDKVGIAGRLVRAAMKTRKDRKSTLLKLWLRIYYYSVKSQQMLN
jgi:single-strand DNA-binding protein